MKVNMACILFFILFVVIFGYNLKGYLNELPKKSIDFIVAKSEKNIYTEKTIYRIRNELFNSDSLNIK